MPIENQDDGSNSLEQCSALKTDVPFLTQTAFLEEHAKADPSIDPEMVDVIIDALRADENLRSYFFRVSPHVGWIPIIWERGFLSTAPEPVKSESGFELPRWEAQE